MLLLRVLWTVVRTLSSQKANLVAENLALRQQLIVLRRRTGRPRLRKSDRIFWLWLARSWDGWRDSLIVVKPGTVVRWLLWAEWLSGEVLAAVPHHQWVFTVPKRLRLFFLYDRRLLGALSRCPCSRRAWRPSKDWTGRAPVPSRSYPCRHRHRRSLLPAAARSPSGSPGGPACRTPRPRIAECGPRGCFAATAR